MENIFLIGFMGSGKSTIAAGMKRRYGMQVVEMDEELSERAGMSIPEIFERFGESYFRDLETEYLKDIQKKSDQVISCGGGIVLRPENVQIMKKQGAVVLLKASPETVLKRVEKNDDRPLLRGKKNVESIAELMEQRRERYEAAADLVIETDGRCVDEICTEIKKKLEE